MGHTNEGAILGVGLKAGLQGLADQYVRSKNKAFSVGGSEVQATKLRTVAELRSGMS